jgi:hypothetical protein
MLVYDLPITTNQPGASFALGQTNFTSRTLQGTHALDGPTDCFYDDVNDRLFITSQDDDVVLYYDGLPDWTSANIADHKADYIIGEFENPGRSQSLLDNPKGITADDTHVYVGDYNNYRIMRFPIPTSDSPAADSVLGQLDYVSRISPTGDAAVRNPTALFITNSKLYTSDYSLNRVGYWTVPFSQPFYQSMLGIYGHNGDFDFVNHYETSELLEAYFYDMATDGKRIFAVDLLGGRIIITPLRQN